MFSVSALFHDLIVYQKDDPRSDREHEESAERAREILERLEGFPKEKIDDVCNAIENCSFLNDSMPDWLEATGVISIMRTYASAGWGGRKLYNPDEPIPEKRKPESDKYGLDLFSQDF